MISDGAMRLERGARSTRQGIVCSFLFGSPELYRWVDSNSQVRLARTETTNDPSRIAAHPAMVSVNTALQVDLFDQAGASHVDGHVYSGFGGQPDFVAGPFTPPAGRRSSRCAPGTIQRHLDDRAFAAGSMTSFQHSALISEHGCAQLLGRSQRAQARLIVERVAHPNAREHLQHAAARLHSQGAGGDLQLLPDENGTTGQSSNTAPERHFGTIE